ncbi:hypothetical protein MYAM1_000711 [Malassezia yamatoensis]|uniref:F-box domain-containing protein n=1 Tax=Malassezia yamatoensis TaxID=253288 RepID=A0AAJ6CG90_9BASI|nr:hypothetical protein MYAM1_000711 [Malassezia yamatoensis]
MSEIPKNDCCDNLSDVDNFGEIAEEARDCALIEAHKQASVEANSSKKRACHSKASNEDAVRDDSRGCPSHDPHSSLQKDLLHTQGFAKQDRHKDQKKSQPRDIHACSSVMTPLLSRSENLCVRHQRMADEDATARLQKSIDTLSLAEQTAVNTVWSLFSSSSHSQRALILRGILTMCCFSQLSLLSSELTMAIRIDPFTLFPREVSLRVLGYLDAISLGRAAQVSRLWRTLADNDLLWRNMCEQHIERKCEKCGWGLPLLTERRRLKDPDAMTRSEFMGFAHDDEYRQAAHTSSDGSLRRTVTAAANAAAIERRSRNAASPSPSRRSSSSDGTPERKRVKLDQGMHQDCGESESSRQGKHRRPWKAVYCERLAIERNWRRGRHSVRLFQGHTDGIMSLSFRESVSGLTYPVLVTGSYDRTVKVWNLRTGEILRTLTGHARGVRCLQFDDVKLITGSMDRSLKIWNWRTGELLRTLEGHTEGIVSLNFNESVLASGSADSSIRIWNFHSGECYSLQGHRDWVNAVQLWSPPASRTKCDQGNGPMFLFSASDDGTIRLWDLQTRECILVYSGHVGQVQSLKLVMMDQASVQKLSRSSASLPNHCSLPIGNEAATDGSNTAAPSKTISVPTDQSNSLSTGSCSHSASGDETQMPLASSDVVDRFLHQPALDRRPDLRKDSETQSKRSRTIPPMVALTQRRLSNAGLVPNIPPTASMDDIEEGLFQTDPSDGSREFKQSQRVCKQKRPVLVSGSLDNTLKLWDVRSGQCIRTLFGHVEGVWGVDVDTLRIVSASHDRTVKVWDRDTAQCQNTLVGHRAAVTCVALDDDKVVSGSDDGDVRLWSFASPRPDQDSSTVAT